MKRFALVFVFMISVGGLVYGQTALAAEKIGVILMHGKGGTNKPKSPLGKLASVLENKGFLVSIPDMPWSRFREFNRTYEQSMDEIAELVASLRSRGATKVVVGGQSIGANAALGYGALNGDMDGLLILAPGHVPVQWADRGLFVDDIARAAAMVKAGNGGESADFNDINQGRTSTVDTKAEIYLSFWNPKGNAVMKVNAKRQKGAVPVFLAVGTGDGYLGKAEEEIFSALPAHPKNTFVMPRAGHKNTPIKAKGDIIKWLKSL